MYFTPEMSVFENITRVLLNQQREGKKTACCVLHSDKRKKFFFSAFNIFIKSILITHKLLTQISVLG